MDINKMVNSINNESKEFYQEELLSLDSLEVTELIMLLEETNDIQFSKDVIKRENFSSVAKIRLLIRNARNK